MSERIEREDRDPSEPQPGEATYALLSAAAGSLITVRTRTTPYVSTMALASPVGSFPPAGRR